MPPRKRRPKYPNGTTQPQPHLFTLIIGKQTAPAQISTKATRNEKPYQGTQRPKIQEKSYQAAEGSHE